MNNSCEGTLKTVVETVPLILQGLTVIVILRTIDPELGHYLRSVFTSINQSSSLKPSSIDKGGISIPLCYVIYRAKR